MNKSVFVSTNFYKKFKIQINIKNKSFWNWWEYSLNKNDMKNTFDIKNTQLLSLKTFTNLNYDLKQQSHLIFLETVYFFTLTGTTDQF